MDSNNNVGENIVNAFSVVYKTYESIQKLISLLLTYSREKDDYIACSEKFLRYKSDQDIYGWAVNDFILVFQNKNNIELENGFRNGPIYVLEINLGEYDEPQILVARFDYDDMNALPSIISPSNFWEFYNPLYNIDGIMDYFLDDENKFEARVMDETKKARYWGINHIKGFYIPLMSMNADNACELIFGGFDSLAEN
ncbi:MAG: hypothetical protein FWH01_11245 [Oscillospiraceae bacterium]|nr:hypothetical protein [Oscillospiraceae bacterium]